MSKIEMAFKSKSRKLRRERKKSRKTRRGGVRKFGIVPTAAAAALTGLSVMSGIKPEYTGSKALMNKNTARTYGRSWANNGQIVTKNFWNPNVSKYTNGPVNQTIYTSYTPNNTTTEEGWQSFLEKRATKNVLNSVLNEKSDAETNARVKAAIAKKTAEEAQANYNLTVEEGNEFNKVKQTANNTLNTYNKAYKSYKSAKANRESFEALHPSYYPPKNTK